MIPGMPCGAPVPRFPKANMIFMGFDVELSLGQPTWNVELVLRIFRELFTGLFTVPWMKRTPGDLPRGRETNAGWSWLYGRATWKHHGATIATSQNASAGMLNEM